MSLYDLKPEEINLQEQKEREEVELFLRGFDLSLERDVDYTLVVRDRAVSEAPIVATCSKEKNVLKCFAVREDFQGEGITALLISALLDKLFSQGLYHSFIFTKPAQVRIFQALNFKLIQSSAAVTLLENGIFDIRQAIEDLREKYALGVGEKAALVMNCNPFTLGHYYLIEKAALENREVLVFIVEEEQSLFPFRVRYELVCKGVEALSNVKVMPGGAYIISSATFPSYFLREEGERTRAYAELDASIFGRYFCQPLNITKRYVGEEPFCPVTRAYNEVLQRTLPDYGAEVQEIKRKTSKDDNDVAISASEVRELLKGDAPLQGRKLKRLLPEVTLRFLVTNQGREIVEKIKASDSPH